MKKLIALAVSAVLLCSCSGNSSVVSQMDQFVDDAEEMSDSLSKDSWEEKQLEYEELVKEYEENFESYSDEEKKQMNAAIGRYHALLLKEGLNDLAKEAEVFTKGLGSYLEGFFGAFGDLFEKEEESAQEK